MSFPTRLDSTRLDSTRLDPTRLDPTRLGLRQIAVAWSQGLDAAARHDAGEARRVLRGAPARRTILRAALQSLERCDTGRGGGLLRRSTPNDVVADLVRMNTLLSRLSQGVLAVPDAAPPAEGVREQLAVAARVGSLRLEHFAATMPRPTIDRAYITAGHELLDTLAALAETRPARGTTMDTCLSLLVVMVETSRHTTHVV